MRSLKDDLDSFKIKYVTDRSKERLVARGFYKKEGINYE